MNYFALVPAAGTGSRMGSDCPKQYLPLAGRPLIWHTLTALAAVPEIARIYVVIAAADDNWDAYDWTALSPRVTVLRCGGETRAASVAAGLAAIAADVAADDWMLVHDAARPCVSRQHLQALMEGVQPADAGGILAIPVADTLKLGHNGLIAETVARAGLWQAQTPQMFRHGDLCRALAEAGVAVTDEASAIEALGMQPRLVAADASNLKVTFPLDLQLAEWILQNRKAV